MQSNHVLGNQLVESIVNLYSAFYGATCKTESLRARLKVINEHSNEQRAIIPLKEKMVQLYLTLARDTLSTASGSRGNNDQLLRFVRLFSQEGAQNAQLDQFTKSLSKVIKIVKNPTQIGFDPLSLSQSREDRTKTIPRSRILVGNPQSLIEILATSLSYYLFECKYANLELLTYLRLAISNFNLLPHKVIDMLLKGEGFAHYLHSATFATFTLAFKALVGQLPVTESALLLSGYRQDLKLYPIYIEITKLDPNYLDIKLFNVHEEATAYHSFVKAGDRTLICPYLHLKGIRVEDFTDDNFIKAYYQIFTDPSAGCNLNTYTIKDFYSLFLEALKPKIIERDPIRSMDLVETILYNQAWPILEAFFKSKTDSQDKFDQSILMIKVEALLGMMNHLDLKQGEEDLLVLTTKTCARSLTQEVLSICEKNNYTDIRYFKDVYEILHKFIDLADEAENALNFSNPVYHCQISPALLHKRNPYLGLVEGSKLKSESKALIPINFYYKYFSQDIVDKNPLAVIRSFLGFVDGDIKNCLAQPNKIESLNKLRNLIRGHLDVLFEAWAAQLEKIEKDLGEIHDAEDFRNIINNLSHLTYLIFKIRGENPDPILETYLNYLIILIFQLCQKSELKIEGEMETSFQDLLKDSFIFSYYPQDIEGESERGCNTNPNMYCTFHNKLKARIIDFFKQQESSFDAYRIRLKQSLLELKNWFRPTVNSDEYSEGMVDLIKSQVDSLILYVQANQLKKAEQELQSLKENFCYYQPHLLNFEFVESKVKNFNLIHYPFLLMPRPHVNLFDELYNHALAAAKRNENRNYLGAIICLPPGNFKREIQTNAPKDVQLLFDYYERIHQGNSEIPESDYDYIEGFFDFLTVFRGSTFDNLRLVMAIAGALSEDRSGIIEHCDFQFRFCMTRQEENIITQFEAVAPRVKLGYGDLTDETLILLVKAARQGSLSSENEISIKEFNPEIREAIDQDKITEIEAVELLQLMTRKDFDNANSHQELQVIKTLSYFSGRLEKLADPQMQTLFKFLFFENNYLEVILDNQPVFEANISSFLEKAFEYYFENGKISAAAFILEVERLCALRTSKNKYSKDVLAQTREKIKKIVGGNSLSEEQKCMLMQQFVASYLLCPLEDFNAEDAVWMLKGLSYNQIYPLNKKFSSETIQHTSFVRLKFMEERRKVFLRSEGAGYCQEVFEEFFKDIKIGKWSVLGYTAKGTSAVGEWEIDIEAGTIYQANSAVSNLMKTLVNLPNFPKNLCHVNTPLRIIGVNEYEFQDLKQYSVRVFYDPKCNQLEVYRQFANLGELARGEYSLVLNSDFLYSKICRESVPKGITSLILKHKVWIKTKEDNTWAYILLTDDEYDPKYLLKLTLSRNALFNAPHLHITDCTTLSEPRLHLAGIYESKRGQVLPFRNHEALLWMAKDENNKNRLAKLELPQLNLTFDVKSNSKKTTFYSSFLPGYWITGNQRIRGLKIPQEDYWVLKNEVGELKVVIVYKKITNIQGENLGQEDQSVELEERPTILIFNMDKNRAITPSNNLQKIYLAYLYLSNKQYKMALDLLRKVYFLPYKNRELDVLLLKELKEFLQPTVYLENSVIYLKIITLILQYSCVEDQVHVGCYESCKQSNLVFHLTAEEEAILKQLRHSSTPVDNSPSMIQAPAIKFSYEFNFQSPEQFKNMLERDFDKLNIILKEDYSLSPLTIESYSLLKPGKHFYDLFFYYYDQARSKHKSLEWVLKLLHNDTTVPLALIFILEKVWNNPQHYPSLKSLEDYILNKQFKEFFKIWERDVRTHSDNFKEFSPPISSPFAVLPSAPSCAVHVLTPIRRNALSLSNVAPPRLLFTSEELKEFKVIKVDDPLYLNSEEAHSLVDALIDQQAVSMRDQEMASEIITYWQVQSPQITERVIPSQSLNTLKMTIYFKKANLEKTIYDRTNGLLSFVNQAFSNQEKEQFLFDLKKLAQHRLDITFDDLCIAAARSSSYTFLNTNPQLQAQETNILAETILILSLHTEVQQLERALLLLAKLERAVENSEDYNRISEKLYQEMTRIPQYNPYEDPQFALFEFKTGFGLFPQQVKDLKQLVAAMLNQESPILLQKAMGSGKTKVYLCLLALMLADRNYLPFIVIPEAQYHIIFDVLEHQASNIFNQNARALILDDQKLTNLEQIELLYQELQQALERKDFFILTDTALHKFNTLYKKRWYDYLEDANAVNERFLAAFINIKKFLLEHTVAICDEADTIYNCLHEYILAGGKPESISAAHSGFVADLFAAIEEPLLKLKPFTRELYEQQKGLFITAFILNYARNKWPGLLNNPRNFTEIFNYLKGEEKSQIFVNGLNLEQRNLLAIALQLFNELLPLILEKVYGVDYGFPIPSNELEDLNLEEMKKALRCFDHKVIGPYVANNQPKKESSYSFPYTSFTALLKALSAEGVKVWMLVLAITELQNRADQELQEDWSISLQDTQAYRDFKELCGEVKMPLYEYKRASLEELKEFYKNKKELTRQFAINYFFPRVTEHPLLFQSSPHQLKSLFNLSIWVTGTDWNKDTWDDVTSLTPDPTLPKVLGLIWKRNQVIHKLPRVVSATQIVAEIAKLQESFEGSFHAFIDSGALFVGIDNKEVAQEFLKFNPSIEGVVFVKEDKLYILERSRPKEILYSASSVPPEKIIYYYDQARTTGTDLPIGGSKPNVYSLLSIGPNTKTRDLVQAYKRERNENNKVHILCSGEVDELIQKDLKVETTDGRAICKFVQKNQKSDLNSQSVVSLVGRMNNVLYQYLSKLLDTQSPYQVVHLKEIIQNLLAEIQKDAPAEIMGKIRKNMSREEAFEIVCEHMLAKMKPLYEAFPGLLDAKEIKVSLEKCIRKELFPSAMKSIFSGPSALGQAEVQSQQQQQKHIENIALIEKVKFDYREPASTPLHWRWASPSEIVNPHFYHFIDDYRGVGEILTNTQPLHGVLENSLAKGQYPQWNVPILALDKILYYKHGDVYSDGIFQIYASWNFQNFGWGTKSIPVGEHRKEVNQVLFFIDSQGPRLILIDQSDSGYFNRHLAQANPSAQLTVVLYDMTLGIIQSNNKNWLRSGVQQDFLKQEGILPLIVQAKLYGGHLIFNSDELREVEALCHTKGRENIKRLCEWLIGSDQTKKELYARSKLAKILKAP